jgi:hypothetical protein
LTGIAADKPASGSGQVVAYDSDSDVKILSDDQAYEQVGATIKDEVRFYDLLEKTRLEI